ncbi:unnamed protein product, partial [Ilex paraguariensis]
ECVKQTEKLLSLSTRLKASEDEKKVIHVDLVKSKAHIVRHEEEKSLHKKVSFLEREHKGIIESKKGLEFKLIKLDRDLHESQDLSKRIFQSMEKLYKIFGIGKSMGDKKGLGYTNENTTPTISKTIFVK